MPQPAPWPNLFIVGAVKCGTTSLHSWLNQHPDVFMAAVKEPHYYAQVTQTDTHRNFEPVITEEASYRALFQSAGDVSVIGEASPSYLPTPQSAKRIAADCPNAKIVIALRHPVERAHSHYLMEYRSGRETRAFADALAADALTQDRRWGHAFLYKDIGLYADAVQRYIDQFGREQIHFVMFEALQRQPQQVLDALCQFLNIAPMTLSQPVLSTALNPFEEPKSEFARRLNRNAHVRMAAKRWLPRGVRRWFRNAVMFKRGSKPDLSADIRADLMQFYTDDISKLSEIIGAESGHTLTVDWR